MTNRTLLNRIENPEARQKHLKERYQSAILAKEKLRLVSPIYDHLETLEILRKMYQVLKKYHNDLPKLRKNTLKLPSRTCHAKRVHAHPSKKQVCFPLVYLQKRAVLAYDDLNDRFFATSGLYSMIYLLAHEVAHWKITGCHNRRFYAAYHRYHHTLIQLLISGELYGMMDSPKGLEMEKEIEA